MNRLTVLSVALAALANPAVAAEPFPISSGTWELKQDAKGVNVPLVVHDGAQGIVTIYRICQENGPEMRVVSGDANLTRLAPGRCVDIVSDKSISMTRSSDTSVVRATGHFHLLYASKK